MVGVGEVQPGGGDGVELPPRSGRRLGDVDDVQDLGTAEAGDPHGTHDAEATGPAGRRTELINQHGGESQIPLPVWAARGTLVP